MTSDNPTFKSFVSSIQNKPADKSQRSRLQKDLQREILKAMMAEKLTEQEADYLLSANEAERQTGNLILKVSAKGALSIYGLGRWPMTLYVEQWQRVIAHVPEIEAYIAAHGDKLKRKGDDATADQEQQETAAK